MIPSLISTALLSFVAGPIEECDACSPLPNLELCAPHYTEELEGLSRWKQQLDSKDESERIEALEAVAALTSSHTNAPSPRVAELLALRVEDEVSAVRVRAIELLVESQHPPIALSTILKAIPSVKSEQEKLNKQLQDSTKGQSKKKVGGNSKEEMLASIEAMQKAIEEQQALVQEMIEVDSVFSALVKGLGRLPDDRAVSMLVKLHKGLKTGVASPHLFQAFLDIGSEDCVSRAITDFKNNEKRISDYEKSIKKKATERLPKAPRTWQGTKDAWERQAETRRQLQLEMMEQNLPKMTEDMQTKHELLSTFAVSRGLPSGPAWEAEPYKEWASWFRQNKALLPESAGTLVGS